MLELFTYCAYLVISFLMTFKVGAALNQNGRLFLIQRTGGDETLAKAINNLLLIGYYLINTGYILLITNLNDFSGMEGANVMDNPLYFLTRHLGLVALMLGVMHMALLYVLANWRPARFINQQQE